MSQAPLSPALAGERVWLICPLNLAGQEGELAEELVRAGAMLTVVVSDSDAVTARPGNARIVPLRRVGTLRREIWPTLVIHASTPPPWWRVRVWWWKRRHAPRALLGGVDRAGEGKGFGARFARATCDLWLAEAAGAAEALRAQGVDESRVLVMDDLSTVPGFFARRIAAEACSVLWVEDDISLDSPSTKHLIYSVPRLRAEGWEIRQWCLTSDEAAKAAGETLYLPGAPARWKILQPYWFLLVASWHGLKRTLIEGRPPARVVHTMGGAFLGADLASIHFVNDVWLSKQWQLGIDGWKGALVWLWTLVAAIKDQAQFSNPRCRMLLPVSDSIAEEVRRRSLSRTEVRTLPNSYDEGRFNPAARTRWRGPMRRDLGYADDDCVFCFASQGHYKRKGFWLAVDSLARLRQSGEPARQRVRFLVVGGGAATIERLQATLTQTQPDWARWITFVGTQTYVERYLSAAEAFLFPSYFEAFCLAEIEVGALGIPLLLTPHPGTEMILQEGVNGLRLSFEPAEIAATLATFLERGFPPFAASPGRALDRDSYARTLAGIYREVASD